MAQPRFVAPEPVLHYFYLLDDDFGPLFIKFGSYFRYATAVCLNGHEWVKRQLAKEGIAFEAVLKEPQTPPNATVPHLDSTRFVS